MYRKQTTDCRVLVKVGDVDASALAKDASAESASFDTNDCRAPSFDIVDIQDLGGNAKLKFTLQESDESAANFTDVSAVGASSGVRTPPTNCNPATEFDADGLVTYPAEQNSASKEAIYYLGIKRYIRLKVTAVTANPGATVRVYATRDLLRAKPTNVGI